MINILKTYYSKFTPNLFWSFASKAVAAVAFILIDVLLARVLEAELYGKWQQFFSLLTLLLLIIYAGIPSATETFAAKNLNKPELKYVLRNSLVLQLVYSGVATGIVLLLRNQIAGILGLPNYSILILISAPYLFFAAIEIYFKKLFVGIKKTIYHFYMNLMSFGLRLLILAILALSFLDIPAIIYGYSFSIMTSLFVGFFLFKKHYSTIPKVDFQNNKIFSEIFLYSLPLALTIIIAHSTQEMNIQILGFLTNSTEIAYLAVGKQITNKLPQIALAVSMGIMPDFAQITAINKTSKKKRFTNILKLTYLLYGFICGGLVLFSPFLIPVVYGASFFNATLPLQILLFHVFFGSINVFLVRLLTYHGRASQLVKLTIIVFIINILLNLLLIPKYGAVGSAIALTLAYLPYNVALYRKAIKVFDDIV